MLTGRAMSLLTPSETTPINALHALWPAHADLWGDDLVPCRAEMADFLRLVSEPAVDARPLPLVIYAASDEAEADARRRLPGHARILRAAYGDIWARDTGPVFAVEGGRLIAVRFRFNGWGGEYELPGDQTIGACIAREAGARVRADNLVCEGGALEFDGEGTVLTTRQCLLNVNRNPDLGEAAVEAALERALGVRKVIWLDEGLAGDHTDGHVDNLARFAAPGLVVCQTPYGSDDPNAEVLIEVARTLEQARDAQGRRLQVIRIPSPGRVLDAEGAPAAASHLNWVIGPKRLVFPAYNDLARAATRALQPVFPKRMVTPSPARHILTGGGAFHCVTCHVPGGDAR